MTAMLASLLTCAALAAPAPFDDPTGDLKTLQGTWNATIHGPQDLTIEVTLLFENDAFTMTVVPPDGEERQIKGRVKLDEKADPKQIDLEPKELKPAGGPVPKEPMLGLYKLEGETFTLCPSMGPGGDRPTEFAEKNDETGPPRLIEFKKQTETPKDSDK